MYKSSQPSWLMSATSTYLNLSVDTRHELTEPNAGCPADFNNDQAQASADLLIFLTGYGSPSTTLDLDGDGLCATSDLLVFLSLFGSYCD